MEAGSLVLHAWATGADDSDTMFQISMVDFNNILNMGMNYLDVQVSSVGGGGGGTTDWTDDERKQIRFRLGLDGEAMGATENPPDLATAYELGLVRLSTMDIEKVTDRLFTMLEQDGPVYRYTTNSLEQAPTGGGGGTGDAMQSTLLAF